MKTSVLVVVTSMVLPTVIPKAQLTATTLTERAADLTRLDVLSKAKHPRGEGSDMDVRSMTVVEVAISGILRMRILERIATATKTLEICWTVLLTTRILRRRRRPS